jgi:hypothetical protein
MFPVFDQTSNNDLLNSELQTLMIKAKKNAREHLVRHCVDAKIIQNINKILEFLSLNLTVIHKGYIRN